MRLITFDDFVLFIILLLFDFLGSEFPVVIELQTHQFAGVESAIFDFLVIGGEDLKNDNSSYQYCEGSNSEVLSIMLSILLDLVVMGLVAE
jgi:hypothetical protein